MHQAFRITAEIEIEKGGQVFLNRKRIDLLRMIRFTGSILAASKRMEISYQLAWTYIKDINSLSPLPVVIRQRGGANGGGAEVTKYGLMLIEQFLKMETQHKEYLTKAGEEMDRCFF